MSYITKLHIVFVENQCYPLLGQACCSWLADADGCFAAECDMPQDLTFVWTAAVRRRIVDQLASLTAFYCQSD